MGLQHTLKQVCFQLLVQINLKDNNSCDTAPLLQLARRCALELIQEFCMTEWLIGDPNT